MGNKPRPCSSQSVDTPIIYRLCGLPPIVKSKKKKIMFFKLVLGVFQLYRMLLFRSNDSAWVMNIEKDSHNKHEGGIKNVEVYLLRL